MVLEVGIVFMQLIMLLWSYFAVVLTDPGSVPSSWRPAIDEERGEVDPLSGSEFSNVQSNLLSQRVRFCRKCNMLKPPRCHHCSVCEYGCTRHSILYFERTYNSILKRYTS